MRVRDLERFLDIDVEGSLEERFMDSEELYARFLRKLLNTPDFVMLQEAADVGDLDVALRVAHNLKGVCANLGLYGLSEGFGKVVGLVRGGAEPSAVQEQVRILAGLWDKTLRYIGELC